MISLNVPQNEGQPPAEALLSDPILWPTALCSEGDARRQASRAVARHLQPFQGWFTFWGWSGGGAVLATGYFLPALQAESDDALMLPRT